MATIQFENIKHGDWIILNEDDEKSKSHFKTQD